MHRCVHRSQPSQLPVCVESLCVGGALLAISRPSSRISTTLHHRDAIKVLKLENGIVAPLLLHHRRLCHPINGRAQPALWQERPE
ncbi:hypothetical protein KCP76_23815 [Salmonella enterica subsp. enterica serovar Weltevreden]|nr:hypothetical protein KCP76_23815 [Salmonella enterica subsp. enterica serovar Weltevreden]